jgi:molybdate-binding protein/DNA-binding XRE family transcriptional regulator
MKSKDEPVRNNLKAVRTRLGMSQQDLAVAAGVARQTVGGMEAGLFAPSAAVALRIARTLGCRVEDLFWLDDDLPQVEAVGANRLPADTPVRVSLARVEGRWVAQPLIGDEAFRQELAPADGIGSRATDSDTLRVQLLDEPESLARTVVLSGCTPALSLWARSAQRWHPGLRVHWLHASSLAALGSLARGEIHAAGTHLYDPLTGEFNSSYVRRLLPKRRVVLVNLGVWEEGLLVAPGNPKSIACGADLARPDVRLINRDSGAGSRLLLDALLQDAAVNNTHVIGYGDEVGSHEEVARAVASGRADVGVSSASMAALYGLAFVPIQSVRYDLAMLHETLEWEPMRQLLETLHHRWVRSQLEVLGGYDTTRTGEIVAEI